VIPAQLRGHLEGPDHNAVIGPHHLPAWVKTHHALHMTVNRGWRARGFVGALHPTDHERNEPHDHDLPQEGQKNGA
jgi:hypothetical protein